MIMNTHIMVKRIMNEKSSFIENVQSILLILDGYSEHMQYKTIMYSKDERVIVFPYRITRLTNFSL